MRFTEPEPNPHTRHLLTLPQTLVVQAAVFHLSSVLNKPAGTVSGRESTRPISYINPPFAVIEHRAVRVMQAFFYSHTGGTEITAWNRKPIMKPNAPVAHAKRIRFAATSCQ